MSTAETTANAPVSTALAPIKIDAAYGRLYVSGPGYMAVSRIRGAAINQRRRSVELSLTLDSLKAIKAALRMTSPELARCCTETVMRWARAAFRDEQAVTDLHQRIAGGHRAELPWHDATGQNRPAFEHQKIMATVAVELSGCAFLCEMGTGKTRAAIEAMRELVRRGTIHHAIVLCPAGVMGTWERELRTWAPDLRPVRLDGSLRERGAEILTFARGHGRGAVLILNYEALYRLEEQITEFCRQRQVGLILDEGHKCKNPNAKVTKAAMKIARYARWRLLMTGTLVLNGIEDVWSQWYIVDLGVTFGANFVQYRREFLDVAPGTMMWHNRPSPQEGAVDLLSQRIARRGLRYRKAECLDLPPKMYEVREVEMTPQQARAYREMAEHLLVELQRLDEQARGEATASTQLVVCLRLSQITSGFLPSKVYDEDGLESAPVDSLHFFEPCPKLDALEAIIREEAATESIIVWAWYRHDIARIRGRLADLNPAVIQGGMTIDQRSEEERRFQARETRVMVANPASAGLGLTLTQASTAIYYSQGYNLEHRSQSEDRCHRAGSEMHNRVTYIDLNCTGSIDEVIRAALVEKKALSDAVVAFRRHVEESA